MTTNHLPQEDVGRRLCANPADVGVSALGLATSQRVSGIREQTIPLGDTRSAYPSAIGILPPDGGKNFDAKLVEAVHCIVDAIEMIADEMECGGETRLAPARAKLSKAREALAVCSGASKGRKDEENDVRRAEGEGFGVHKGEPAIQV